MKYFILFAFILSVGISCSRATRSPQEPTATAVANKKPQADLITELKNQDIFEAVQTSQFDADYQVVKTKNGEDYFVKNGVVVSSSRTPKHSELTLIYWRYFFKGKNYVETKVDEQGPQGHHLPMIRVACDSEGMGVIYDPNSERITRVFYYEAK